MKRSYFGASQIVGAVRNDELVNKKQAIIDGAVDTVSGIAVTTAAAAHMFGHLNTTLAGLKQPAGIVAVGAPFVKTAYGMIASRKTAVAAKEEALSMSLEERQLSVESNGNKQYYMSPVAKWLVGAAGGGALDMGNAKA